MPLVTSTAASFSDLSGTIALSQIASGTFTADAAGRAKFADGFLSTAKLADAAITTDKIADDAVTDAKIAARTVTPGRFVSACWDLSFFDPRTGDVFTKNINGNGTATNLGRGVMRFSATGGGSNRIVWTQTTNTLLRNSTSDITVEYSVMVSYQNGELAQTGDQLQFGVRVYGNGNSAFFIKGAGYENDDDQISCFTSDESFNITSTADISFTRDTWHICRIIIKSSSVEFYIDGTLVATHTTNLPSTSTPFGLGWGIIRSSSEASNPAYIYLKNIRVWA